MLRLFLIPSIVLSLTHSVHAGATLSLEVASPTIVADSSGNATLEIDVVASADAGTQPLMAYDLFVDIGGSGGVPAGWALNDPVEVTSIGDLFTTSLTPSEGDVLASAANTTGVDFNLTTTPITLWTFQVDLSGASGAVDGDVNVAFLQSAMNFGLSAGKDANGNSIDIALSQSPASAMVRLQGFSSVPEPSAFLMAGVLLVAMVCVRPGRQFTHTVLSTFRN